jgi:hypothetical protein
MAEILHFVQNDRRRVQNDKHGISLIATHSLDGEGKIVNFPSPPFSKVGTTRNRGGLGGFVFALFNKRIHHSKDLTGAGISQLTGIVGAGGNAGPASLTKRSMNDRNPSMSIHLPGLIRTDLYTDATSTADPFIHKSDQRVLKKLIR